MTPCSAEQESDAVRKLLEDVQRTLQDNQKFIHKLKEDDVDLEPDEESVVEVSSEEDGFEEL